MPFEWRIFLFLLVFFLWTCFTLNQLPSWCMTYQITCHLLIYLTYLLTKLIFISMRQDHLQEATILSKVQDQIYKKTHFQETVLESGIAYLVKKKKKKLILIFMSSSSRDFQNTMIILICLISSNGKTIRPQLFVFFSHILKTFFYPRKCIDVFDEQDEKWDTYFMLKLVV